MALSISGNLIIDEEFRNPSTGTNTENEVATLNADQALIDYLNGLNANPDDGFPQYAERDDMIAAYYLRLTDPDPDVQLKAARAWSAWEGKTLSLLPDPERVRRFSEDAYALAFARIECHYFIHGGFFDADDQLIRAAHRLKDIPGVIVHGRYDVVTPAKIAADLARAWPEADVRIVADAGHAMTETGIVHELVTATKRFVR